MKIALLAPIEERVPPNKYGGVEAVVYTLAEQLTKRGEDVTVFASGDSKLSCRVVPLVPKAIGSSGTKRIREALTYQSLTKFVGLLKDEKFDLVHNHVGWQALLFRELIDLPVVTTIHWTLDNACENLMYKTHQEQAFVSISNNQRRHLPNMNYADTIYHGLELGRFDYSPHHDGYLAFFGRFSPEKGPAQAIEVAKKTGQKLIMAGKTNKTEMNFYNEQIAPHVDGKQIINIGELDHSAKVKFLKKAKALLTPIQWDEPFGLTNIEAMACGTPVIAIARGSLPEIIDHGRSGFLCKTVGEMAKAVGKLDDIVRADCRKHVEKYFSAERMVDDYLKLYHTMMYEHANVRPMARSRH